MWAFNPTRLCQTLAVAVTSRVTAVVTALWDLIVVLRADPRPNGRVNPRYLFKNLTNYFINLIQINENLLKVL